MRLSNRYGWTVLVLAFPLVRCAVSAEVDPNDKWTGGFSSGPTGGTTSTGGVVSNSGTTSTGGVTSTTGGTLSTGGATSTTGGTLSTGGTLTGGAGGASAGSGGKVAATGGSSGTTSGGSSTGGTTSKGGSTSTGGAVGTGGALSTGGSGGKSSTGGTTSAGATSTGGSGGAATGCLAGWQTDSKCGPLCTGAKQGDQLKCIEVLDCYVANSCGPSTCSGNDQKCGANKLGFGTAPYPLAQQTYDCMCN